MGSMVRATRIAIPCLGDLKSTGTSYEPIQYPFWSETRTVQHCNARGVERETLSFRKRQWPEVERILGAGVETRLNGCNVKINDFFF